MPKKQQPAGVGMTPSRTELGSFIRTCRLKLDLKQVSLAKRTGLSQMSVSVLEVGIRKYLNDWQLERLAKALQCDPEELRKRMPVKPGSQPSSQPKTELGKLIRSRREELGLTLKDFAKKMGVSCEKAKNLETRKGAQRLGSYSLARLIAGALELAPSILAQFVGGTVHRQQIKSELGRLIRARRTELLLSLAELAERLSVSREFVKKIEFGQCSLSNSNDMIKRLAKVLKLDVNELQAIRSKRRLKQKNTTSPLGGFLAAKRLELHLTQREVGERVGRSANTIYLVERGGLRPSPKLLDELTKALGCEIPADLERTEESSKTRAIVAPASRL